MCLKSHLDFLVLDESLPVHIPWLPQVAAALPIVKVVMTFLC